MPRFLSHARSHTIPTLQPEAALRRPYPDFIQCLRTSSFQGDIQVDYATRLVTATDNSVYQVVPQAVVFPRTTEDIVTMVKLAALPRFRDVTFSPRGGGTGTNGQSLNAGIIVDLSKHLRHILELNVERGWVRVEPGVVLDQLNANLKPHGVFFAPTLSPSSHATLGGMVNTDACGKGSRIYGKTSDHIIALRTVLLDGTCWESRPINPATLASIKKREDRVGMIHRCIDQVVTTHRDHIAAQFPKLNRFLTGYDLAHVYNEDRSTFNLNAILAGSEGTLGFVSEATLKLTKIPHHTQLIVLKYASFDDALHAAQELGSTDPGAIETIDETILTLARENPIWHTVASFVADEDAGPTRTINLVEFESDDPQVITAKTRTLTKIVEAQRGQRGHATGYYVTRNTSEATALWNLRKSGVGLLGSTKGERRPIPFVEDTAVPPEHLAAYVREFRALLDNAGLSYGMFGHVDVGCLHVRPALNMRNLGDEAVLRTLSDQVVALVKKYGGVMWGEHGKGYRSEYSPQFFGEELYGQLCHIKEAFDPHNQLNPGKLATPSSRQDRLVSVDGVKRGFFDRQISTTALQQYEVAVACNGNGACFHYDPDYIMCPSSKITRDRIHSPKGRAGLMREWLRQLSISGFELGSDMPTRKSWPGVSLIPRAFHSLQKALGKKDFSHEVYQAMEGCLSCKACATQCPLKVDVPVFKADFGALYHRRYLRPLKDHFLRWLETMLPWLSCAPRCTNFWLTSRIVRALLFHVVGIIDPPAVSIKTAQAGLRARRAPVFDACHIASLGNEQKQRSVALVQDAFTSFYESKVILATYDLLHGLGYTVYVLPYRPNGKGLHVKGFVQEFHALAQKNVQYLRHIARQGVPLFGIDPAVTLTYRDEYVRACGGSDLGFQVHLPQEWLVQQLPTIRKVLAERGYRPPRENGAGPYTLFGHCTERTAVEMSQNQWREVFAVFGLALELAPVGCCGMCGMYGHETAHYAESQGIYEMSWQAHRSDAQAAARVLATGHSCRSQVQRFDGFTPLHPLEALAQILVV